MSPASLTVTTAVTARLSWDHQAPVGSIDALYEQAKSSQWNASSDIDWGLPVDFGGPLPDDSPYALAAFEASPLAPAGRAAWDSFRWEFQSWMISQFMHGEQGALVATARLVEELPTVEAKRCAALQVADEARHLEVLTRYLGQHVPVPYPICPEVETLVGQALGAPSWDMVALGMQVVIEPIALAGFRLADSTFHDRLIRQIAARVARDEARHMSFGVMLLPDVVADLSPAELADRETFVLEAAHLMRRRFDLLDVWERLGVDPTEGARFAATNDLMVAYRQAIFAKVVSALRRIGLMTRRVHRGLEHMDLLTRAARTAG